MEGEIIPMCEDQGMAVVPWAALGGGQILTKAQREEQKTNPDMRGSRGVTDAHIRVSEELEKMAEEKNCTLQALVSLLPVQLRLIQLTRHAQALAYLFHTSTYVFPVVGVNTVEHVKSMPDALRIKLDDADLKRIHGISPYDPGFPMSFLYNFRGTQDYHTGLTASHNQQTQMAAWIDVPPKQQVHSLRSAPSKTPLTCIFYFSRIRCTQKSEIGEYSM